MLSVCLDSTDALGVWPLAFFWGPRALFMGLPNSAKCTYPCIFGSYSIIHTFKNYFVTVFSVISFQFLANKRYPNRPKKWKLFHYSAYFCYYSWAPLHFLALFMSHTILFQLTFTFIYSIFSNNFSDSIK